MIHQHSYSCSRFLAMALLLALVALPAAAQTPSASSHENHSHGAVHDSHSTSEKPANQAKSPALEIPSSLRAEHEQIHEELARLTKLEGPVGEAARDLERALHPHFLKEEQYAMPPLAVLPALVEGKVTPEMHSALPLSEKTRSELPQMLAEHKGIAQKAKTLQEKAKAANQTNAAQFAQKLMLHAQNEEQILYPASILAGEMIRSRLGQQTHTP